MNYVLPPEPQTSAALPPCSPLLPFGEAGRGCSFPRPTETSSALSLSTASCCKAARISLPASASVPKHYARSFPHARCIAHKYGRTPPASSGKNHHIASRYNQARYLTAHRCLIFFCTLTSYSRTFICLADSISPLF